MKLDLEYLYNINNAKVWSIELKKNIITIQFGKKGSKLNVKKIVYKNDSEALEEYKKRIREKKNKGYSKIEKNKHKIEIINPIIYYLIDLTNEFTLYRDELQNKLHNQNNINTLIDTYYKKNIISTEKYINKLQNKKIMSFMKSGIITKKINKNIQKNILNLINQYCNKTSIDYHPSSDNKVRDIIHPSLYPLIKKVRKSKKLVDYWDRPYENSNFQWLPSEFKIDKNGKCKINSYINNLPITELDLYENIEKLFNTVLPEFENVWSYINALKLYDPNYFYSSKNNGTYKKLSLCNRTIQVITKIVKISLDNKEDLLGAWHVEGMSHENIIATASCTLEQEDNFDTELYFKRIYTSAEADYLTTEIHQYPPDQIEEFVNKIHVPLGKTKIEEGSMIVFPNCNIHKIDMKNTSSKKKSRTIIVFWLINPEERIISTKDIKQQNYDIQLAYKKRLELMKERTFYKQTFNQRDLNLCEH